MSASVLVALPLEASWARIGTASIEQDPGTGTSMLCLRLCAMAPTLYLSVVDLRSLLAGAGFLIDEPEMEQECAGHA